MKRPAMPPRKERMKRSGRIAPMSAKRRARGPVTSAIRVEVERRAAGDCENCGVNILSTGWLGEMDHARGASGGRPKQSVENCWLLCKPCHGAKTDSKPSPGWWFEREIRHFRDYSYTAEAERAQTLLDVWNIKRELEALQVARLKQGVDAGGAR